MSGDGLRNVRGWPRGTTTWTQTVTFKATRAPFKSKHLLRHRHICFIDNVRTTIEIRDDLYYKIIREYGKRKISITINEILSKHFSKKMKDMFGADTWLMRTDLSDLRDEHDRNV